MTKDDIETMRLTVKGEYELRSETALAGSPNLKENELRDFMAKGYASKNIVCRITLRPAKVRYDGIMKGDGNKSTFREGYWQGISINDALKAPALEENEPTPLVYDPPGGGFCWNETQIDFTDYYFVRGIDDRITISFPNSLESGDLGNAPTKALIHICSFVCPWDKCPKTEVKISNIKPLDNSDLQMSINHQKVVDYIETSKYCAFLKSDEGWEWHSNESGKYDVKVNVLPRQKQFRLTSIAVMDVNSV